MSKKLSIIGIVGTPHWYGGNKMLSDVVLTKLVNNYNFTVFFGGKHDTSRHQ